MMPLPTPDHSITAPMEGSSLSAAAEIAFFDVETTVPLRPGAGYSLLEFGAVVVCRRTLVELASYSTLIRPHDPSSISPASVRCNGITRDTVTSAPSFRDVAPKVFDTLNGRVWEGHNIVRFDCLRIREAFEEVGLPAPEAKGLIDTLPLLTERFGRRAGNMKMATLATYFGLGQQKHRSLDDVRMNLEVVKSCATVLFLESSLPDVLPVTSPVCKNASLSNQVNGNVSPGEAPDPLSNQHPQSKITKVHDQAESSTSLSNIDPSCLMATMEQMNINPSRRNDTEDARPMVHAPETCTTTSASEGSSGYAGFLEPGEVLVDSLSVCQVVDYHRGSMTLLHHRNAPLQICCQGLRVQFGISAKYADYAGRPKLNIVVNFPASLCEILDACDRLVQKSGVDSGSRSEWRPTIMKNKYSNSSSIRLHLPLTGAIPNSDVAIYSTEIFKKEPSGDIQELSSRSTVLEQLFVPGTIIDAYFSLDVYDFQQNAGIRLVAKRLVAHTI
ncbi:protein NEN1-like [Iris pallida]|uniref:Protein NEN1-like n=1 Tax=Iris pallida TaxID=29817 RepID=A0AAX6HHN7_IRIPA|nr:protein NEN1-like [Iris pallida]